MAKTDIVEQCTKEAAQILRRVDQLRRTDPKKPIRALSFRELADAPLLDEGQPEPDALPSEIYAAAIRFWACAVARQIDLRQWRTMIEDARTRSPGFNGDAIRFFEEAFEGLKLTDGTEVYP